MSHRVSHRGLTCSDGAHGTRHTSGPVGVLLATRYKTYQLEASSTLALTTLSLLLTLPITFSLIGGA